MAIKKQPVKTLFTIMLCFWSLAVFAQGTFVYRTAAEVGSSGNIDLNLDGTSDFNFGQPLTGVGNEVIRSHRLTPSFNPELFPEFPGEIMKGTSEPIGIGWSSGQPILADPGPGAEWSDGYLNMTYMVVAIRLRNGQDWSYGWMRFEKVGEDPVGDLWGLRDAAYNSIPNAPINMLQVPEPSTFVLMVSGAVVVLVLIHRKRRIARRGC